jgi:hypothetical protein
MLKVEKKLNYYFVDFVTKSGIKRMTKKSHLFRNENRNIAASLCGEITFIRNKNLKSYIDDSVDSKCKMCLKKEKKLNG